MAIECYYSSCPYHAVDEPLCDEEECHATEAELRRFDRGKKRRGEAGLEEIGIKNFD